MLLGWKMRTQVAWLIHFTISFEKNKYNVNYIIRKRYVLDIGLNTINFESIITSYILPISIRLRSLISFDRVNWRFQPLPHKLNNRSLTIVKLLCTGFIGFRFFGLLSLVHNFKVTYISINFIYFNYQLRSYKIF